MPTGYTDQIKIDTSLREWALVCAQAFFRLDGRKLPKVYKEDLSYERNRIKEIEREIRDLQGMTNAELAADIQRQNAEKLRYRQESIASDNEERVRYERMQGMVEEWDCPVEAKNLKKFMLEQLRETIQFDCPADRDYERWHPINNRQPEEYRRELVEELEQQLARARNDLKNSEDRIASANAWLKAVRESLP